MASDRELLRKLRESEEVEDGPPQEEEGESLEEVERGLVGLEEKKALFRFLKMPTNRIKEFKLTKDQATRLSQHVKALKTGTHAAVPLICAGLRCPFVGHCPLTQYNEYGDIDETESSYPVLEQCPVESNVLALKIIDLAQEYNVDEDDVTDVAILTKIAELDVYDHRLSMILSQEEGQGLMREEISHIDKEGMTYHTLKIHPALDAKEKISKQRDSLVRAMLGTRREKAKAMNDEGASSDLVNMMTKLKSEIQKIRDAEEAITIEGEVAHVGD